MEFTTGQILEGKVKTITKFGAFISLPEGRSGLVHISEIAYTYVNEVRDFLTEGQDVKVQVLEIDDAERAALVRLGKPSVQVGLQHRHVPVVRTPRVDREVAREEVVVRALGDGARRGELRERRECGAFGGADGANRQGGKRERDET